MGHDLSPHPPEEDAPKVNDDAEPEVRRVGRARIKMVCSYCKGKLTREEVVLCATCRAPQHEDCRQTHGACSTLGCQETRVDTLVAAGDPRRLRRNLVVVATAILILLPILASTLIESKPKRPVPDERVGPKGLREESPDALALLARGLKLLERESYAEAQAAFAATVKEADLEETRKLCRLLEEIAKQWRGLEAPREFDWTQASRQLMLLRRRANTPQSTKAWAKEQLRWVAGNRDAASMLDLADQRLEEARSLAGAARGSGAWTVPRGKHPAVRAALKGGLEAYERVLPESVFADLGLAGAKTCRARFLEVTLDAIRTRVANDAGCRETLALIEELTRLEGSPRAELERLRARCFQHADAWIEKGRTAFARGEFGKAVLALDRAVEIDPNRAEAFTWRGRARFEQSKWKRSEHGDDPNAIRAASSNEMRMTNLAHEDLSRAVALDPKSPDAWFHRSLTHRGHYDRVVADLERVLDLQSDFPRAHYHRGHARLMLKDHEAAKADLSRAIELEPQDELALYYRGWAHEGLGDPRAAVADYTRILEIDPNYAGAYYERGKVRVALGELRAALADLDRAVELYPTHTASWNQRGQAHAALGEHAKAVEDFTKALEGYSGIEYRYRRGVSRIKAGDEEGALEDLHFVADRPENAWRAKAREALRGLE